MTETIIGADGRPGRIAAEAMASAKTFLRRRTAVFFTFVFPLVIILIFAGLVRTQPSGGGLFARPTGYYVPGYLAVVVLFTPLSRVSSEVTRYREQHRFQTLAVAPLSKREWLAAQTVVNVGLILAAGAVLLGALALIEPTVHLSLWLVPYVIVASILFCGIGAMVGQIASSQDGAVAMSNGIALPLLFLSETFVSPSLLPSWFEPISLLSPLTYFARGVRLATYPAADPPAIALGPGGYLVILTALAVVAFLLAGSVLSWTDQ